MYTLENFIGGLQKNWTNINITINDEILVISRILRDFSTSEESVSVIANIPISQIQEQCDMLAVFSPRLLWLSVNIVSTAPCKPVEPVI